MKRIMTALALMAVMCVPKSYAQEFGVTGGLNIASFTGHTGIPPKDGIVIGGFANISLYSGLSLQPELLFSMKGAHGTVSYLGSFPLGWTGTSTMLIEYLEVPVLVRARLFTLPVIPAGFDVFAGPDFAYNVYSWTRYPVPTSNGGSLMISRSMNGDIRAFDFNITVGGGPHINLGLTTVGLELRYTFGTGRVFHTGSADYNNNVWSIMASASL